MYQHPIIPFILCTILLIFVLKQSLNKHQLLKGRFFLCFFLCFGCGLILVFYHEIKQNQWWNSIVEWILLGIDLLVGLCMIVFLELSASKENFNHQLFETLSQTKLYCLVDRKNRITDISDLFLQDLGFSKEEVLKKNLFDVIEKKYRIFSLNGTEASKKDLNIYYSPVNQTSSQPMNLEIHDEAGDVSAYYFTETPILLFGKLKGRLFVGDKKGSETLVGMEKNLADSVSELELIKSRFITVLEKTKEGIFFADLKENSIWINDILVQQLCLSGNSLSLEAYQKNIHPDDLPLVLEKLRQVNQVTPSYLLSYRYNIGTRYAYVQEEGMRISNGKQIERCGMIRLLDHYRFAHTDTELDKVLGEPELFAQLKRLLDQQKVFQIVYFKVASIPDLNEKYGRNIGNMALSEYIKLVKFRYVDQEMIYRLTGLDFIALITDYRKMDLLKNSLMNQEKILHVSAEYGAIKVDIQTYMGIVYSTEVKTAQEAVDHGKTALLLAMNPKYNANYAYYKDRLFEDLQRR